jgi:hypothetical protein
MSGEEVISLLGRPTSKAISDISGEYWCYGSSSWMDPDKDSYCGNVLIEMSRDGHVVKTPLAISLRQ